MKKYFLSAQFALVMGLIMTVFATSACSTLTPQASTVAADSSLMICAGAGTAIKWAADNYNKMDAQQKLTAQEAIGRITPLCNKPNAPNLSAVETAAINGAMLSLSTIEQQVTK